LLPLNPTDIAIFVVAKAVVALDFHSDGVTCLQIDVQMLAILVLHVFGDVNGNAT